MTATATPASEQRAAQIRDFRRYGWIRVEGLLGAGQLEVIKQCWADALANPPDMSRIYTGSLESDPAAQSNAEARKVLQKIADPRLHQPAMRAVAEDAAVAELVRDLLGAERIRLYYESFLEKQPESQGGSKETPWHQDFCYEPFDRRDVINVWVAVEDMDAQQGSIELLSGSHRLGALGRLDFTQASQLVSMLDEEDVALLRGLRAPGDVDGPLGVPIGRHALQAGDALVWQAMTMHHAPPNTSTLRRRAYQRTYISDEVRYTAQPAVQTDGLGLQLGDRLERDRFPLL